MNASDKRLGDLLIGAGSIDEHELQSALVLQQQYSGKIGELLVNQGSCTEDDILSALSVQLGLPRLQDWGAFPENIDDILLCGLERKWWLNQRAAPLGERDDLLWVAMPDVMDSFISDTLWKKASRKVMPVIVGSHELRQLLSLLEEEHAYALQSEDESLLQDLAAGAPIVQFVNDVIQRAMDAKASDIHFESYRGIFRVRFRVDGVLHEVDRPNLSMQPAIISRLKLMAGLDISEKRLPQDGRIRLRVGGSDLDIRVATSPGIAGESVVLRLLLSEGGITKLEDLNMHPDHRQQVDGLLTATNGIILVTGPTGSGKSTTLYSFLRHLSGDERKIITVEDPVEYQVSGITQIPVNSEIGLTFASVLRSVLRQDPDVVLIGEIRDRETAEIAVQAALTGHLVLSTLHTNDAASAFVRLMDMGVESYLLASSVIGVLGQRLVRSVCPHCRSDDAAALPQAEALGWGVVQQNWPDLVPAANFVQAGGCEHCLNSGYRGRRSLFEVLSVDEPLRHMLATEPERVGRYLAEQGMRTMRQDGLLCAAAGETTVAEVLRVTG